MLTLSILLPTKLLFLVRESNQNVSILVLRVAMRYMKFYYFSTHHLIGVENNNIWGRVIGHPNFSIRKGERVVKISVKHHAVHGY